MQIYNLKGQLVRTYSLVSEAGARQSITWDGINYKGHECSTGIYFIRLKQYNETISSRKITLIR